MNFQWWGSAFEPKKQWTVYFQQDTKHPWESVWKRREGGWTWNKLLWEVATLPNLLEPSKHSDNALRCLTHCPAWTPWASWVPYHWGYSLLLSTDRCCFGLHMQIKSHKQSPILMTHQSIQTRQGQNNKKNQNRQQKTLPRETVLKKHPKQIMKPHHTGNY